MAQTGSASRSSAIRDKTNALFGVGFDSRSLQGSAAADRFSARQVAQGANASRFTAIRIATVVISASRFDARGAMESAGVDRFSSRFATAHTSIDRFSTRFPTGTLKVDRLNVRHVTAVRNLARNNAFVPYGWAIYARNTDTDEATFLGFIAADDDPKKLTDVSLADGVWEIEARPSQWFWNNCRGRKIVTLYAGETATGGGPLQGLPEIQNLRREIVDFESVIKWRLSHEYDDDFSIGLWFSPTSPVSVAGDPDAVVSYYSQLGDYEYTHEQSSAEYVAVAAFNDDDIGPVTELELPWESISPASPTNQFATKGG